MKYLQTFEAYQEHKLVGERFQKTVSEIEEVIKSGQFIAAYDILEELIGLMSRAKSRFATDDFKEIKDKVIELIDQLEEKYTNLKEPIEGRLEDYFDIIRGL